ncbi:ammonium transporter [Pseudonocardia sp. KRD-169]|uniref:Ammonium transporter n=2 Tax=Pseudonocardia abyssalis TaxID=2792008 RepID=A0ABS6UKE3_9PSEU|nr:ammonium transporter [Pseudonocardia abyssalis]MBW0132726.1 ammonium transporter [Pseudonocardia abyssalis]
MLMTPGLALFYGGMVRAKSVLNMMMMSVVCLGVVGLVWVLGGFSLAFGDSTAGLIGNLDHAGLRDVTTVVGGDTGIPLQVFAMFQLMFAVITAALLSGAVADRARFWPFALFIALWTVFVYVPLAHWIFAFDGYVADAGGWMANTLGALDFAGGTAVEINSGASALALAIVLGRRRGWPQQPMRPHNLPSVLLGAGLLWFGWFGFNAGSALAAGAVAGNAFVTTLTASAAAVLSWLALEHRLDGRPTSLGAASAAIAGLVGITPACGYVDTFGALAIGLLAGVVCQLAIRLKYRLGYDDSLDVVAIHGVGGIVGMLMLGFVATSAVNDAGADGLFYGGGFAQLGKQAVAVLAAMAFAFTVSYLLARLIRATIGFRVDAEVEAEGIDEAEHAESAYDFMPLSTTARLHEGARLNEGTTP